jgi:hypothetical protein
LIVTEYPSGALQTELLIPVEGQDSDVISIGSPNGRTSAHGFFTSLGLAIGEQFKQG